MNALISIIVPVYNAERYLAKCVDSLLSQSYSNLEIILVNDGSKDGSLALCREYEAKDPRIVVIDKENGGASSARNAGLDIIKGEYVSFVDSDDYLETEAISILINAMTGNDVDITCMCANIINSDYSLRNSQSSDTRGVSVINSKDYVAGMCRKEKSDSVCDKLFKVELFSEHRFENGRLNEDFFFLSKLLFNELTIAEIDFAGYNYYQREGSITHSGFSKAIIDAVKNSYELKQIAHETKPELEKHFAEITLFQARVALLTMPWEYVKTKSNVYLKILEAVRNSLTYLNQTAFKRADKMFLRMVNKIPRLTLRLTSLLWSMKMKNKRSR